MRAGGSGQRRRLKAEMPHPAVPALGLAVRREIDEAVAGDSLLANRSRELAQLLGIVEMAGRLEESQRPAGRERRPAEQLGHLAHDATQVATKDEVPDQPPGFRGVGDPHPAVGAAHRQHRVARIVEEERVAAIGHEQRHAHVRPRAVSDVRVPELARDAEPVDLPPALAQAVEVLLAGELEGRVEAPARVAGRFREHSATGRFSQKPVARGIEEGQAHRTRRHLDPEIGRGQTHARLRRAPRTARPPSSAGRRTKDRPRPAHLPARRARCARCTR